MQSSLQETRLPEGTRCRPAFLLGPFLRTAQDIAREHSSATGLAAVKEDRSLEEVVDAIKGGFNRRGNTRWLLIYNKLRQPKTSRELITCRPPTSNSICLALNMGRWLSQGRRSLKTFKTADEFSHISQVDLIRCKDSYRMPIRCGWRLFDKPASDARKIAECLDGLSLALAPTGAYLGRP
ncbi:MAG: hypothetical protein FRX48_09753 [Lasallia pustulata]|uniref:Uncharacterized protein n=1 Tax=Lasallia pustulata TaxID=136370 RepID=A0A5M8PCI8_9LECA|nr:MAG: hypothetical protein FRX48_09753 [Lasallia pustulata]